MILPEDAKQQLFGVFRQADWTNLIQICIYIYGRMILELTFFFLALYINFKVGLSCQKARLYKLKQVFAYMQDAKALNLMLFVCRKY